MARVRLRPDVGIRVEYDDRTRFGSPVGRRPESSVRTLFASVVQHIEGNGPIHLGSSGPALLEEAVRGESFQGIVERQDADGWDLRADVLFPDPNAAPPRRLALSPDEGLRLRRVVLPEEWPPVHSLLAELSGNGADAADPLRPRELQRRLETLEREGLLEEAGDETPASSPFREFDVTFLGHNTVVIRSSSTQVVLDPMLFPTSRQYPADYQPIQVRDLGRVDAVLITHSHPDHLDPGSLLRFSPETLVIVPRIERETLLAVAIERRVRELGFANVTVLDWWEGTTVGDIAVHAVPFHGEQPTEGERLHPDVRNHGDLFVVRTPTFAAAFLADSGRDGQGDAREVALEARRRLGPVDLVFSGYRGWLLYPVQFVFSSVARYLLFVPPALWGVRQHIMNTADEAVDVAEAWGARYLVPYADGGAPWYWERGLGPRLDEDADEHPAFDPFPERVIQAARNRSEGGPSGVVSSPVDVLLLRPGDSVLDVAGRPVIARTPGHGWPYPERIELSRR